MWARGNVRFVKRIAATDLGFGAFLMFASCVVVRSIRDFGQGQSAASMGVALFIAALIMAVTRMMYRPVLELRSRSVRYVPVPLTMVLAAAGVIALSLASVLPLGTMFLYGGITLMSMSASMMAVVWTATIDPLEPRPSTFSIPPVLIVAVALYFVYIVSIGIMPALGEGVFMAIPLVAIAAFLPRYTDGGDGEGAESVSLFVVLAVAVAACAVVCGAVAQSQAADLVDENIRMAKVVTELMAVLLIVSVCFGLFHLSRNHCKAPWLPGALCAALVVPTLLLGLYEGVCTVTHDPSYVFWDLDVWVLVTAVFAYDGRSNPFAVDGLAIGQMFESMCFAQLLACSLCLMGCPAVLAACGLVVAVLYLCGVFRQVLSRARGRQSVLVHVAETAMEGLQESASALDDSQEYVEAAEPEAMSYPEELTAREREVFDLLIKGRDAQHIAGKLGVSYHTVRCHIRHIYEKLDVHSQQDLLDLVAECEDGQATAS